MKKPAPLQGRSILCLMSDSTHDVAKPPFSGSICLVLNRMRAGSLTRKAIAMIRHQSCCESYACRIIDNITYIMAVVLSALENHCQRKNDFSASSSSVNSEYPESAPHSTDQIYPLVSPESRHESDADDAEPQHPTRCQCKSPPRSCVPSE